jgi:hypothetical protein
VGIGDTPGFNLFGDHFLAQAIISHRQLTPGHRVSKPPKPVKRIVKGMSGLGLDEALPFAEFRHSLPIPSLAAKWVFLETEDTV